MVTELTEVLKKVALLQDEEQRQLAHLLQQEMLWDSSFSKSQDQLSLLAKEAVQEYKSGKSIQTDW